MVLIQEKQLSGPDFSVTLHFAKLDGRVVGSYSLPNDTALVAVGGSRVFFVHGTSLRSVDASGDVTDQGTLAGLIDNPPYRGGLVISPDGKEWVWSAVDTLSSNTLRSRLFLGGDGMTTRQISESDKVGGNSYLDPVLWSPAGVVVVDQPGGIGGYPLFFDDSYWWNSTLLNPSTFASSTLTQSRVCPFNDLLSSGEWTCSNRTLRAVEIHGATTATQSLAIDQPALQVGHALMSSDHQMVAVGFNNTDNTGSGVTYDLGTMTIGISSGKTHRVGPRGDVPAAWLPDGSLVLQDEQPSDGYPQARCDLVAPDGTTTALGSGGFLGVLDAAGSIPARTPAG